MSNKTQRSTLPLVFLPHPLILLPGARLTFPISNRQAESLIRLIDSSLHNPLLAAVPLVQHQGNTSVNKWGVTALIKRFVRPGTHSDDERYFLTLAGIARVSLLDPSKLQISIPGTSSPSADSHPLPRVDVIHPPPDAELPPPFDVAQDFKAVAIRLLERLARDNSQSLQRRESWSRIAQLVEETEIHKVATLADAIVSAVGAEHADKLGGLFFGFFTRVPCLPSNCPLLPRFWSFGSYTVSARSVCFPGPSPQSVDSHVSVLAPLTTPWLMH
jgi:ATP-dependent Lon protease